VRHHLARARPTSPEHDTTLDFENERELARYLDEK
jgi:hypothetical protein